MGHRSDPYEILLRCRAAQIPIRGGTDNLARLLEYRRTGKYQKHGSYWARKFLEYFLYKLGRAQSEDIDPCPVNDDECVTSVPVGAIPRTHYFDVVEDGRVYAYDIRTLTAEPIPFNAYTGTALDTLNNARLNRKMRWLRKYYPNETVFGQTTTMTIEQLITEVINKLSKCMYVHRSLLEDLNLQQIKDLYCELNERIPIADEDTHQLFAARTHVLGSNNRDHVFRSLLQDVNILATDSVGSINFMTCLTHVSDAAAYYYGALLGDY